MTAAAFDTGAAPNRKPCITEGCERTDHKARGLCGTHYDKWRRALTPENKERRRRTNLSASQRARGTGAKHGLGRCQECGGQFGVIASGAFHHAHHDETGQRCRGCDLLPISVTKEGPAVRTIPRQRDSHTEVLPQSYPAFDGTQPCIVDPEFWFPSIHDHAPKQKALCGSCPFVQPCAEFALLHPEEEGVWGGLTQVERVDIRKRMRRTA